MNTYGNNVLIKAICFSVFSFLFAPQSANAEWYWLTIPEDPTIGEFTELSAIEYAVTPIPKDQLHSLPENLMSAFGSTTDSVQCSGEYDKAVKALRDFDAIHGLYTDSCYTIKAGPEVCDQMINQETINARTSLLSNIEKGAVSCLKAEQKELEKQAQKEAEAERLARIADALEACDTDFFENEMTNEERMHTWDERQECINETEEVATKPANPIVEEIIASPTTTVVPEPISAPVTTPKPVVTAPTPTQSDYTVADVADEATTTDENAQEGIEEVAVEVVQPAPAQTGEVEKLSFFKKITGFFAKLFSW